VLDDELVEEELDVDVEVELDVLELEEEDVEVLVLEEEEEEVEVEVDVWLEVEVEVDELVDVVNSRGRSQMYPRWRAQRSSDHMPAWKEKEGGGWVGV